MVVSWTVVVTGGLADRALHNLETRSYCTIPKLESNAATLKDGDSIKHNLYLGERPLAQITARISPSMPAFLTRTPASSIISSSAT